MFEGLMNAVGQLADDASVRAVVLHGEGKSFCSGLDIASFMFGRGGTGVLLERDGDRLANFAQCVAYDWSSVAAPVSAAMPGNCFGGGLQIALGADFGHHGQAEEVAAAARGSVGWPRTPRAGRAGRNVDSLLAGRVGATKRAIARWIFYSNDGRFSDFRQRQLSGLS